MKSTAQEVESAIVKYAFGVSGATTNALAVLEQELMEPDDVLNLYFQTVQIGLNELLQCHSDQIAAAWELWRAAKELGQVYDGPDTFIGEPES